MKKKITLAAYLAGVTTIAVSLPAMADQRDAELSKQALPAPTEASQQEKS